MDSGKGKGFRLQRLLDDSHPIISGIELHDIKLCAQPLQHLCDAMSPPTLRLSENQQASHSPMLLQANVHTNLRQPVYVCLSLPKTNSLTFKPQQQPNRYTNFLSNAGKAQQEQEHAADTEC